MTDARRTASTQLTPQHVPVLSMREGDRLRAIARRVPGTNAGAQNNCGVMLARRGLFADAAACFERALDMDARMTLATQNLQQLSGRSSVDADRVRALGETIRRSPRDVSSALALGKWHARLGRPADAATVLGTLLDHSPDDLAALREMALVEQALGYPDRASAWLERAVALAPGDVSMHALAGEILYRRGKTEAARRALEHALEIDESAAWPQHLLAFVLGDMGELEQAQAAATRALQLDPSLARVDMNLTLDARPTKRTARGTRESDGRAHLNLGIAYRNTGYFEQAFSEFDAALVRGEPAGEVQTAIGETRVVRGEWSLAAAAYADAATALPGIAAPRVAAAAMYLRAGDTERARVAIETAFDCDRNNGSAFLVLGVIESLEQRPVDALSAFKRARGSSRTELAARLNAAWVMRQLGRHAECLEGFRRATESDPQNVRAWIGVGVAFAELRRLNEAAAAFERAATLAPDSVDAAYHLAFTMSQLGRYQEGVQAMKRAMKFEGEFAPFRFLLILEPELQDVVLEVAASDLVSGDSMALMTLSGASNPHVTAEHMVILADPTAPRPMRDALPKPTASEQVRTPLGAWVALRRGGTPVTQHAGTHRNSRNTPVIPFARRATGPGADTIPSPDHASFASVELASLPMVVVRNAEQALRTALATDPDLAQVRVGLAALLREDGRVQDAEEELVRALHSVPTFHDAARALAELRVDVGRPSDAMQALVRPLRANPRDADLLVALAEALFALGREEQATSAVSRGAAVAPDHVGVRTLQGYMAMRAGRAQEALQHWRVAAATGSEDRWASRARLALAEHDDVDVPHTPVIVDSVRSGSR
jgi:tetratricopeptide (TPR) repeat protein